MSIPCRRSLAAALLLIFFIEEPASYAADAGAVGSTPADQARLTSDLFTLQLPKDTTAGGVTVYGDRDDLNKSDDRLKRLSGSLPCCNRTLETKTSIAEQATQLTEKAVIYALKATIFHTPRERGEPMDEALHLAQEGMCLPSNPGGCMQKSEMK